MRRLFFRIKENEEYKKYNILSGLITLEKEKLKLKKTVRIVGFPVYKKRFSKEMFFDNLIDLYPQYEEFYIFTSRSGEFYLLMHHLKEWLANNNSVNPLFVFKAKYHVDIFKMFFPNADNYVYIKYSDSGTINSVSSVRTLYKGKKFYLPTFNEYFLNVENSIRDNNAHYYSLLKKHLGLKDKPEFLEINLPQKTRLEIENYAKYILHNKFVFISPESLSNEWVKDSFWQSLVDKFLQEGYEVFCNAVHIASVPKGCKSAFLTFPESIELVKYAEAVVGLRSGFIETLTRYQDKQYHVLYTNFQKRGKLFPKLSADKVLSGFGIKPLPFVNKDSIFEYDMNLTSADEDFVGEIVNKILDKKGL